MSQTKENDALAGNRRFRLLLVDDHPVVLGGYRMMLESQTDLDICATATNAADAISAFQHEHPDLVLVDLSMPSRGGLDLIKDLLAVDSEAKVLVYSMHDEMLYAERALRAGAKGYMTKDSSGAVMVCAIRRVLGGGIYLSERLSASVLATFAGARPRGTHSPLEKLSDRELEVFVLFGEGKTAKDIASKLNLSPKTVSVHRDHIKAKMEFLTSAEMIRQAVRWVEAQSSSGE